MILTMCLNIGIDPEEWREEISKDVPVAREECGLNFWTKDDYELDNRNNDAKLVFEITFLEATFLLMMSPLIRFIKTNAI